MSRRKDIRQAKDRRVEKVIRNGFHICLQCNEEIHPTKEEYYSVPLMEHVLKCTGKKSFEC